MPERPLVTVVTPSFNSAAYIRETIESVLNQDYAPIEHIVVDGASTDGTLEILRQYPHLVWVSEPDRGQSHALNKGFQMAQGEIIGWLNADDSYQEGAISIAVAALEQNFGIDIVYSDCNYVDEEGGLLRISKGEPFDLIRLFSVYYIKQPTVFMRRGVIDDLGGVDERLHYVLDWELWFRAGLHYKFRYLEDVTLANFRITPGTKTYSRSPDFIVEMQGVLQNLIHSPGLNEVYRQAARKAYQRILSRYHYALFLESAGRRQYQESFRHFIRAAREDFSILTNRGVWKHLIYAILDPDRLELTNRNRSNEHRSSNSW